MRVVAFVFLNFINISCFGSRMSFGNIFAVQIFYYVISFVINNLVSSRTCAHSGNSLTSIPSVACQCCWASLINSVVKKLSTVCMTQHDARIFYQAFH